MSKYYGTEGGLWSDGANFRPYRDTPGSSAGWTEVACPECGEDVEVRATVEPQVRRCGHCAILWEIAGDRVTRVPERPWHPTDRGYEPPRGSK